MQNRQRTWKHRCRAFVNGLGAVGAGLALLGGLVGNSDSTEPGRAPTAPKVALIDTTDLYHPPQDSGDNFDLVAACAIPEVDLRAVILDATEKYRRPPEGPRDPGFIPVLQLNSIFGRNVPCGTTPYLAMKSPGDTMLEAPPFQQAGIELLLETLRHGADKVEITVFGSARAVAVAYNREPELLRQRVRRIHLCAGASSPDFLEWNVVLDPHAFVRLLRSDLPVAIYPCATKDGPFAYGRQNCFWKLPQLSFVENMHRPLRAYLAYAFTGSNRPDFLRAVEEAPSAPALQAIGRQPHNLWETAVWLQVAGRRLVQRADGHFRILPAKEILPTDTVLPSDLRPCRLEVRDNGAFTFQLTDQPTNVLIYDRGDPVKNEQALREALPALYLSFRP
jgi:pyrimidine-specific ribonucleoside hydrolase